MIIMHVHGTQVHTRYAYTYTCILHIFKDYFLKKIVFSFYYNLQFFSKENIYHSLLCAYILVYQIDGVDIGLIFFLNKYRFVSFSLLLHYSYD